MSNETTPTNGRDDALMRAVGRLPREIEPRRDLWPAIDAGIDEALRPKRQAPRFAYAMAAAIGCMVLGSLITLAVVGRGGNTRPAQTPAQTQIAAATPATVDFTRASFGSYAALGPEYERARANLAINLAQRLDRLPPKDREMIQRNLADIRRSLREINMALAIDPDSTLLQELLLSTYHSELALLSSFNQMAGSLPARTDT